MDRVFVTGRSVPEWIGTSPDSKVPPHVRLRVFERCGGVCHITGRKIRPGERWELEHISPLADGGEHRETNMAPALDWAHKQKTAGEAKARAKVRAIKRKHLGMKESRNPIPGSRATKWKRTLDGRTVER